MGKRGRPKKDFIEPEVIINWIPFTKQLPPQGEIVYVKGNKSTNVNQYVKRIGNRYYRYEEEIKISDFL